MIKFADGDMFDQPFDIRVNPINCVGVMGKGLALAFKHRYPLMFEQYVKDCKSGSVMSGKMHVWKGGGWNKEPRGWIINFPTKRHWRDNSRLEDVRLGLIALREYLLKQGEVTVALPPLGCGLGRLKWDDVSALILCLLSDVPAKITVFKPA